MTEEEREQIAESKTFAWAAPVILPLIEKRKRIANEMLLSQFRSGKTDLTNLIAEISALDALEREIKQRTEEYRTLEARK